jgi:ABC-type antimicrobial peptide transport system, ATPase component
MLIEIKNLVKEYTNEDVVTSVLHGLNFEIAKGEFVSIMGPSGSGKSTLMHILGLLDRPTGGVYKFDGHNVQDLDDNQLAIMRNEKIGFVFQAFNLLPRTTVLENVKLPLLYSKKKIDADARAKEVLTSVGLEHRFDYFTNQISGGEKQRVAIARALVNDPEIIFADEPTGNLDSKSGIQVMEIFQKLNDLGHTIILVTHETATAEYADRIIRVRDGQIIGDEKVVNKRRGEGDGQLK